MTVVASLSSRILLVSLAMVISNGEEVKPASPNPQSDVTIEMDTQKPFRIFVGYDPREDLAYEVCRYSILKRSSIPVEVIPIKQSELRQNGEYWRERGKLESTEFSFSRFLTPFLANYEGWAAFVDCDFLYLGDVKDLRDLIDDKYAIMCVQHDYTPKETTKMDGAVQTVYPRKNWSSMVLYNCGHPKNKVLTPEVVNTQSGAFLHRFQWLDDHEIGSVSFVWNFLVGHNRVVEGDPATMPKAIHYTLGGPWFEAWKDCEFGDLWLKEMEEYKKAAEKELPTSLNWGMKPFPYPFNQQWNGVLSSNTNTSSSSCCFSCQLSKYRSRQKQYRQRCRCHIMNMSSDVARKRASSMPAYLPCVAAFAASRLVSAAWTFSAAAVLKTCLQLNHRHV
ncbi:hypothetical protein RJ639_012092 [Escallonia herrerae]|uniref:Glycosyltransferase n=1 Tax=Escallonia herrerae TaxID=1293975 RepID=A0AA89ANI4_9ASTE|nr:hypothetical protein RJ639_012092 [Escallonia herrerae]